MRKNMGKIKFDSVGVQAALIIVIGTIIVASINIVNSRSALYQENEALKQKVGEQKDEIESLGNEKEKQTSEIQRLETILTPFRTIALEKYTGSEKEVLKKLRNDLTLVGEKTLALEDQLKPRIINQEQINFIASKISLNKDIKVRFLIMASDLEIKNFKDQIKQAIEKAGWEVTGDIIALAASFEGITLYTSEKPATQALTSLYSALKELGFKLLVNLDPSLEKNLIVIKIGKR
jgi:hypothetical protein